MKMSLFNIIAGLILIIPYVVICTPIHRHSLLDSSQQKQQQHYQQQHELQQHQQQHLYSMKNDDFPFGTIPSSSSSLLSGSASNTDVSSRVESPLSMSSTPLLGGTRLDEDSDRSLLYEQEMGTGPVATNDLRHEQEHGDNFLQENNNELYSVNEEDLNEPHLEVDENGDNGDLTAATSSMDIIKKLMDDIKNDEEVAIKSVYLMKLLQQPSFGPLPIVYVEEPQQSEDSTDMNADKRSGRYYRRYPWKRQNGRYRTYEADTRYLCVPSREDVFKLLVGLHENRNGNHQKTVSFCNRKRPAKSIFTNIRFIG